MNKPRRTLTEDSIEMRDYSRALALYCVSGASTPVTASEIAEHMGTVAMSEGHPQRCWRGINAGSAAGFLRALESKGQVKRQGERRNTTNNRPEPLWVATATAAGAEIPTPPECAGSAPVLNTSRAPTDLEENSPYATLSRTQLLTVLQVTDQLHGTVARFMRDIQDVSDRARRELAAAGIELPG